MVSTSDCHPRKVLSQAYTLIVQLQSLTGEQFGLGSEGSFGGGPYPGLMNWDEEVICFYDKRTGIAIYVSGSGDPARVPGPIDG